MTLVSCPDSVSQTGIGTTTKVISCAGSIGGFRQDTIFITGGTGATSVSTLDPNPPAGAITGTIGANLDGAEIMIWHGSATVGGGFDLPHLDLVGATAEVRIQSDATGTLSVALASGSTASSNLLSFSAVLPATASFTDVLIPLQNPTVIGSGANQSAVTAIGLSIAVPGGSTRTIEDVSTTVPEPSMKWLLLAVWTAVAFATVRGSRHYPKGTVDDPRAGRQGL
jgi:hypothetical protein